MFARRKKKSIPREAIHEELVREWRGCDQPDDLEANVTSAADWIDSILKKQFFAESLDEEQVKTVWKEIAGDFISAHTEPVSVKDGDLLLRVAQPAMRFHLEQLKPELLRKIQDRFGKVRVKSIRFHLG